VTGATVAFGASLVVEDDVVVGLVDVVEVDVVLCVVEVVVEEREDVMKRDEVEVEVD